MLQLLILSLAVYRITIILTREDGPFSMFENMRIRLGILSHRNLVWDTLASLMVCPYCLGVWVSTLLCCLSGYAGFDGILMIFAVAGLQSLMLTFTDRE